jgi:hypothetical protein
MSTFSSWAVRLGGAAAGAALMLGCIVEDQPGSGGASGPSGGSSGTGTPSGGSSSGGASAQPMLVDVDPNQTLSATPGAGVGVFVQYMTGGHCNIWWTCDTTDTGVGCSFQNTVSVATGTINNVATQDFEPNDTLSQVSPQEIQAVTYTSTAVDSITFDTPFTPGQTPIITVEAQLSGQDNGSFLFFVQDGEINGGFKGTLTDPLQLEPSTP